MSRHHSPSATNGPNEPAVDDEAAAGPARSSLDAVDQARARYTATLMPISTWVTIGRLSAAMLARV